MRHLSNGIYIVKSRTRDAVTFELEHSSGEPLRLDFAVSESESAWGPAELYLHSLTFSPRVRRCHGRSRSAPLCLHLPSNPQARLRHAARHRPRKALAVLLCAPRTLRPPQFLFFFCPADTCSCKVAALPDFCAVGNHNMKARVAAVSKEIGLAKGDPALSSPEQGVAGCIKAKQRWIDPDFPPTDESMVRLALLFLFSPPPLNNHMRLPIIISTRVVR